MKRKTKIVCTIGPSSENEVMIEKMIDAGMNVARLNFSHGSHDEHRNRIETIRRVAARMGSLGTLTISPFVKEANPFSNTPVRIAGPFVSAKIPT